MSIAGHLGEDIVTIYFCIPKLAIWRCGGDIELEVPANSGYLPRLNWILSRGDVGAVGVPLMDRNRAFYRNL